MKKYIKKVLSILMIAVILASCFAVPASALTGSASTNTYYVYQEESYGSINLSSSSAVALTYCELASAGKIANCYYFYLTPSNTVKTLKSVTQTYSTGSTTTTRSISASGYSDFSSNYGAFSANRVRVTSYVTWISEACEDRPLVGRVTSAYSAYNDEY